MNILVTGASGFVGRAVVEHLNKEAAIRVYGVSRMKPADPIAGVIYIEISDVGRGTAWQEALIDIDLVIHTAARVHLMEESATHPLTEYRRVNTEGTLNLAHQAAKAGVRRFIFLSSIKVNGECTQDGKLFHADDRPEPTDAYSRSKFEAETGLQELSQACDMEVVVIRPPLVYGPGVRANFLAMMEWVRKGWPVPFGSVDNKRSLVALDNLVDLIVTCARHPAAANQVFLVSDDEDVSIADLIRRIGVALRKPVRFIPLPSAFIRTLATLTGKQGQVDRLLGSLQVDIGKTRRLLGWSPVVSMDKALEDTARYYVNSVRR